MWSVQSTENSHSSCEVMKTLQIFERRTRWPSPPAVRVEGGGLKAEKHHHVVRASKLHIYVCVSMAPPGRARRAQLEGRHREEARAARCGSLSRSLSLSLSRNGRVHSVQQAAAAAAEAQLIALEREHFLLVASAWTVKWSETGPMGRPRGSP